MVAFVAAVVGYSHGMNRRPTRPASATGPAASDDVEAFIDRWEKPDGSESANFKMFANELCDDRHDLFLSSLVGTEILNVLARLQVSAWLRERRLSPGGSRPQSSFRFRTCGCRA